MKHILYGLLAVAAIATPFSAHAEIQQVQVIYDATTCQQSCIDLLNREFRKQAGVADLSFNQPGGQTTITWKPNVQFSFQAVQLPMAMVGLYIQTLRVKVKGTIQHDKDTITLVSLGDGTRFVLFAPIQPNGTNYTEKYNSSNRGLSQEMRAQFIDAESKDQLVTVEGPIFMPYRSPPLNLVVERSKIEDKSQNSGDQQDPSQF